jgi:hypothetical protein
MPARLFLVERYLPDLTEARLEGLAETSRAAAGGLGATYLGSVAMPRDETCFCLFRAPTRAVVEALNAQIGLPHERIVEALAVRERAGGPE